MFSERPQEKRVARNIQIPPPFFERLLKFSFTGQQKPDIGHSLADTLGHAQEHRIVFNLVTHVGDDRHETTSATRRPLHSQAL